MRAIRSGFGALFVSYLIALVLMVMPMPGALDAYRPDWLSLVLLYWLIALPHRVSMGTLLVLGLCTDILLGSTFGVHAVGLLVMGYIAARNFQRIRNFSMLQQMVVIGVLIAIKRLVVFQIEQVLNDAEFVPQYLWPVFTSAIMWLWLFHLLRKVRRNFRIV